MYRVKSILLQDIYLHTLIMFKPFSGMHWQTGFPWKNRSKSPSNYVLLVLIGRRHFFSQNPKTLHGRRILRQFHVSPLRDDRLYGHYTTLYDHCIASRRQEFVLVFILGGADDNSDHCSGRRFPFSRRFKAHNNRLTDLG